MEPVRFFVMGGDAAVMKMIADAGHSNALRVTDAQAVVFTGGADVTPFLYGEKCLTWSKPDFTRDLNELAIFKRLPTYMPKIGICRGGQFLNVMSGGRMWQHVTGHMSNHMIKFQWHKDAQAEYFNVSSDHHQMMIPGEEAQVYAWSNEATDKHGEFESKKLDFSQRKSAYDDVEICYYWNTNSLCFQPHPEYSGQESCRQLFWELVEELVLTKKKEAA